MSRLPTGTVTLLFTDIEGSTRLWEQHPDEMTVALARHDALLRSAIESAGGYVFKTVGDAFCAAFAAARDAVVAAGSAQSSLHAETWPENARLRVRMALHTGECEERDGDYFGPAVNRVARLEATAHGGQVLASHSTADLVDGRLPPGVQLVNLGSHELKDLQRPEEVFQLVIDGVPASFPPLRTRIEDEILTEPGNPTNLTRPVSSFVGRDDEMARVKKLLGATRLVTLAGSGGVGKTRLATEVGRSLLAEVPDGVWLVELASLVDPQMVATGVLGDLGIAMQLGREPLDSLVEVLADQERLVILDNCEHVLDGAAALADAVLRRCPNVRMLATSREPLRIDGEVIYRVPSLSLPPENAEDRSDLAGSGAVALFVERASAQVASFEVTDEDAVLVASICRRLDGMPLALELATARLRSMSLAKLHDRLEHRFGLLTGGSRVALPRQQTLGALVNWSFELLSEFERAVFRRSSVFVDGFDLEAAERVCALDDVAEWEVADHLGSLVDKSMVVAEPYGDDLRYRLQETLHEYGAERLAESPSNEGDTSEADRAAGAHCDYYLGLAEQAAPHLEGRSMLVWFRRLDAENLNLRAAIEHALDAHEGAERVLRQFWAAQRYWRDAPQPAQNLALLERALDRVGPDIGADGRTRALYCKGLFLSHINGRQQLEAVGAALDESRESRDRALEADALAYYSRILVNHGRVEEAVAIGAEALALARHIDDPVLLGTVLAQYETTQILGGDPGAEASFLEGLALVERTGDDYTASRLHDNYAVVLLERGDAALARRHIEQSLQLVGTELNARTAISYGNLGLVLLLEGDPHRAESLTLDVLRSCRLAGVLAQFVYLVLTLACCASQLGAPERAAVLHGGADSLIAGLGEVWEPLEARVRAQDLVTLRTRLGDKFESLYAGGVAMTADEIAKVALSPR